MHCHTKDNVSVSVQVAVQSSVRLDNTDDAMCGLASMGAQIDSYVSDVVRSAVPHMPLDEAAEGVGGIRLYHSQGPCH